MRFDDMIATVLERRSGRADQRAAQWRQIVDLLAQQRDEHSAQIERAYEFLHAHRAEIDLSVRARVAAAYGGLRVAPRLIRFFAEDHPQVAAAMLRGVRPELQEWLDLLPQLSPTGRAVLRHRRDLPEQVVAALERFGPNDFVLEGSVEPAAVTPGEAALAAPPAEGKEGARGASQIWELVERIEAFKRSRNAEAGQPDPTRIDEFRWETGPEGIILWVDGAPRGPLVGQSIAAIADHGQHGVDGQAAGAFEKRAPFRDARFTVAGDGVAAGSWRISGVPYFDSHRGNFLGYRGTARRPRLDEDAARPAIEAAAAGLFGTNLAPDSLRQLIHELRTPLNAIIGFAEMIEGQYLGPAGSGHRGRATEIVDHARRLLGAVDDLDTAARIESRQLDLPPASTDAAALLTRLHDAYAREAVHREARLEIMVADELPPVAVEAAATERMFARLLAATIGLAEPGETIRADMSLADALGAPLLRLAVDRPAAISGLDEPFLLQPGYSPDGDWPAAPALGLGFALRLVRKLAEAAGGRLEIEAARFALFLPAVAEAPVERADGETG